MAVNNVPKFNPFTGKFDFVLDKDALLHLDQTTPQTTVGRFAFPNLAVDNGLIYTDSVNKRVGIGITDPTYKLDVRGTSAYDAINSNIGYNIQTLTAPIAPTATVGSGGSLSVGKYYYFVTYTTATGETNAGSVVTVTTTTGNQKVTLTNIPISSDPRVTRRKIYRTKVNKTSDDEYYLATINDNTTTTYIDTTADNSLTGLGVQYYKVNTTATQITLDNVRSLFIDNNLTTLGKSAGNALITGNSSSIRSVFIGSGAGQKVTTGRSNTVVGVAFGLATTASSCSILGDLAGYAITTGGANTIIGAQAGRFLTTGSRNIMLGSGCAGYLNDNSTQLLNPTNCIYIGNNVKGLSSNETNSIVIGEGALGIGSNSVVLGNDSITKTALKGNVGVGTTSPTQKADIRGDLAISPNGIIGSGGPFYAGSVGQGTGTLQLYSGSNGNTTLWNTANFSMIFGVNNNEVMRFKTGKVGVKNENPSFDFDVTGIIRATDGIVAPFFYTSITDGFRFLNSSGATTFVKIDGSTGFVGFRKTTPTEAVHIVGNLFVDTDSNKLLLGAGKDASAYYDGINMIINPKEVGSGYLDVLGDIKTTGYKSSDGSDGATLTIGFTDKDDQAHSVTIKNGLITAWTVV